MLPASGSWSEHSMVGTLNRQHSKAQLELWYHFAPHLSPWLPDHMQPTAHQCILHHPCLVVKNSDWFAVASLIQQGCALHTCSCNSMTFHGLYDKLFIFMTSFVIKSKFWHRHAKQVPKHLASHPTKGVFFFLFLFLFCFVLFFYRLLSLQVLKFHDFSWHLKEVDPFPWPARPGNCKITILWISTFSMTCKNLESLNVKSNLLNLNNILIYCGD